MPGFIVWCDGIVIHRCSSEYEARVLVKGVIHLLDEKGVSYKRVYYREEFI